MSTEGASLSLDADEIKNLVGGLRKEEQILFSSVVRDVKDRGDVISDALVDELAKKIADKAKQLSGDGGGQ